MIEASLTLKGNAEIAKFIAISRSWLFEDSTGNQAYIVITRVVTLHVMQHAYAQKIAFTILEKVHANRKCICIYYI